MSDRRMTPSKRPSRLYATLGGDGREKLASRCLSDWGYVSLNDQERAFVLTADAVTGDFVLEVHKVVAITQAGPVFAERPAMFVFRKGED